MELVDPVSKIFFVVYSGVLVLKGMTRKSVGTMVGTCNMDESKMECENGDDPAIDTGTWGNVGIHEHAFDIAGVDFNDEVSYADEIESQCTKSAVEAVKFEFGL
jgi:hypothetical protein